MTCTRCPGGKDLVPDVEGLALYAPTPGAPARYLVVSSQGNDSYLVFDAFAPYAPRGAFRIGMNLQAGIDVASETDGLEVTARALGPDYPRGLLVVQDGRKRLPDGPQNFKLVDWRDVAQVLKLP
jgi:3-phytase